MAIKADCFTKHGFADVDGRPHPVKEHLFNEASKYGDDVKAQIKAIKDLQHDVLDNLHNTYHQLGVAGYEKPAEGMRYVQPDIEPEQPKIQSEILRDSAARLREDGDEEGAAALEKRAAEIEGNVTAPPAPPADTAEPISDINPESEQWTAIRKEEITSGIELAKRGFDTGGVVTREESVQSGLRRLAAEAPTNKSLYEAASDKVTAWADRIATEIKQLGKSLFNPNDEELAQMLYHRTATQERMSGLYDSMSSDSETERRLATATFQGLMDELTKVDYVLNETGRVQGRAFGFKQYEGKLDPEYGLQIRRMDLAAAKGAKLTDDELSWVFDQWQKEQDLNMRESELKQQGMQESFDKQMSDLQKEYEEKLKEAAKGKPQTAKDKTLSQKGKDVADKIRKLKTDKGSTKVDFTFGGWDLAVEGIAKLVEAGATIAEAIDTLIKENSIGFKTDRDKREFENTFVRVLGRDDVLAHINENAQLNKVSGIHPEMVEKNMIRDYVDSHIGEVEPAKVLDQALSGLKKTLPDVTKQELIKAYLKEGEYSQKSKKEIESDFQKDKSKLERIAKMEKDLTDLKDQKDIFKRSNNKANEKKVDNDISKAEASLKKEMSDQGVKYSNEDKFAKSSYESRAKSHNDRVDNLLKKVKDKIDTGDLTDEQKVRLNKLNAALEQAKISINPNSRLSQRQIVDGVPAIMRQIRSEFERGLKMDDRLKLADTSKSLQRLLDKFNSDKDESEQNVKLQRAKERLKNENAERQRKLNAGEYEDEVPKSLRKTDAELIKLQKERNKIESGYRQKREEIERQNRHWYKKTVTLARAAYVAALIWKPVTFLKVAVASLTRPIFESATKGIFGNVFKAIFPEIAEAAARGGESGSWRTIKGIYSAYYRQVGAKRMEEIYQKANDKYEASARAYNDFKKNNPGQESKELKDKMFSDMIDAQANILYQYIGGSSVKDAVDSFIYRSNAIEREFGNSSIEKITGGGLSGGAEYFLNLFGRSHAALKTFSGRAGFAAGFIARLEGAVAEGVDISKPDKILEIADESYLDWERGKYQQANFITNWWNHVIHTTEKFNEGNDLGKYSKAVAEGLRFDVAITRVPVNIIHEAVAEYSVGAFRAFWESAQAYRKAKKEVLMNDNVMPGTDEFKQAVRDQLKNMDKDQAALIYRCFRKGGFGLGLFAFSMFSGMIHFGGFHHKGEKKKKDSELADDEQNPGEMMFGNNRVGKVASSIISHLPVAFSSLMGLNYAKVKAEQIEKGETTIEAAKDAMMSNLEAIQDDIPQAKTLDVLGKTSDVIKGVLKGAEGMSQYLESWFEGDDIDEEGNMITRKPLSLKDHLNLLTGQRGKVLTEDNYKKSLGIKRTYATAISNAHKTEASKEQIDDLIKERDDAIQLIYDNQ